MILPTLKDSRGKESTTAFLVGISWAVVTVKFLIAGMALGGLGVMPAMGAGEYGTAVGVILAIWLGREWTEKRQ